MDATARQLVIPMSVVSPTDIARLQREIENIDEFFRQSEIRQGGTPNALPRYSRLLDEMVVGNSLNLLQAEHRTWLLAGVNRIKEASPVFHISFSVDPPGAYVQKIVAWLREHIDQGILVRVGLQPNIGAGCVVRTINKSFDFSLRKFFDSKHEFFMEKLHEVVSDEQAVAAVAEESAAAASDQPQPSVEPVIEVQGGAEEPVASETPIEQSIEPVAASMPQPAIEPVSEQAVSA
ncbi:MAG: hypothetical protein ACI9T8_000338 [Candidatus Saccharimonadales bacterium]